MTNVERGGGISFRYHKVGLLVLFVHDITDIWLELAKALHYLSVRKGKRECPRWETAANASFVMFVLCWYVREPMLKSKQFSSHEHLSIN